MRTATLVALLVLSAVLAALELLVQPSYIGAIPVPLGMFLVLATMPWMVFAAGEVSPSPLVAGGPLWIWVLVTGVLGLAGPGGDTLLPATWQTLLLVLAAVLCGLIPLRRIVDRGDRERAARNAASPGGTPTRTG
ncbi:hypothetical protein GCM10009836_22300 [Pseudonocardia ailaonensis]|uniref:Uncharacterized protein n=1 Tax=Pseudonocardia ailaonensis TaxID=367279 RepID=A0ABN2MXL2_9PSEU